MTWVHRHLESPDAWRILGGQSAGRPSPGEVRLERAYRMISTTGPQPELPVLLAQEMAR